MLVLRTIVSSTAIGILFARDAFALGPSGRSLDVVRDVMPRWYVWALVVPLIAWTDRRLAAERPMRARLLLHVPIGLWWTAVAVICQHLALMALGAASAGGLLSFAVKAYPWDLLIYGALAGIVIVRDRGAEVRRRAREAAALELRAARVELGLAEARLRALGSQLHQHFYADALSAVSAYTERDPAKAWHLMAQLRELLRASLEHSGRAEVTLREELALLDAYLDIQRARFEGRLTATVIIDAAAADARVPAFLLQPLVENAITHGIAQRMTSGCVDVEVRVASDDTIGELLRVRVRDDGVGLPRGWRLDSHQGVGLHSVAARLDALYASRHRFRIAPAAGGGVLVAIDLPFQFASSPPVVAGAVPTLGARPLAPTREIELR